MKLKISYSLVPILSLIIITTVFAQLINPPLDGNNQQNGNNRGTVQPTNPFLIKPFNGTDIDTTNGNFSASITKFPDAAKDHIRYMSEIDFSPEKGQNNYSVIDLQMPMENQHKQPTSSVRQNN